MLFILDIYKCTIPVIMTILENHRSEEGGNDSSVEMTRFERGLDRNFGQEAEDHGWKRLTIVLHEIDFVRGLDFIHSIPDKESM